jgi:hypothetical protein
LYVVAKPRVSGFAAPFLLTKLIHVTIQYTHCTHNTCINKLRAAVNDCGLYGSYSTLQGTKPQGRGRGKPRAPAGHSWKRYNYMTGLGSFCYYYTLFPSYYTPCIVLYRTVLCPQWGPRNAAARAARYYSTLHRTILKMFLYRYASSSHIHSAYCAYTYNMSVPLFRVRPPDNEGPEA